MARRYAVYDVFTDRPLSGNPLAVVLDAEGLDDESMQAIAREFNLSETVFVRPPENPAHRASLRIFTPGRELPFAGHPTVGAAIALGGTDSGGGESRLMVLEERIGSVRCALRMADSPYAEFDVPVLPEQVAVDIEKAGVAAAIGLDESEIGFENHTISVWTAGNSFVFVPVHGLDAAAKVSVNAMLWSDISPLVNGHRASLFLYCRDTVGHDCSFHGRMFAPEMGVSEDPATGSAVANFSGVIARFDGLDDGPTAFMIEQGIEMGRPSRIRLEIDARGGEMQSARIGGHAVKVAEGMLDA